MSEFPRYLRIPPWSKVTCCPCAPRDGEYDVHVKLREHKKHGAFKVHGILCDYDRELPVGSTVRMEIVLSEDSEGFVSYGRVVGVDLLEGDNSFKTKIDFTAISDNEVQTIAHFAAKFY